MLKTLDNFFSILPFFLILYHFLHILHHPKHLNCLKRLILIYLLSIILKLTFKKKRANNIKNFNYIPFINYLRNIKSNYGFPSSHAMFYFSYFLFHFTIPAFFLFVIGSTLRVVCGHHKTHEILFGWLVVFVVDILFF